MRGGFRALGAILCAAGAVTRCASAPPRTVGPLGAPAARFDSLLEAEPALLALEDRRAFDAAAFAAAAASSEVSVRARAAIALGRIGDERAAALLKSLLGDSSKKVLVAAAFGCGILGDPKLTSSLRPLLRDPDPAVAARAAWSLGFLEQPAGQDALVAALSAAPEPGLEAALLRALWHFSTPAAAAAAMPRVRAPDTRIRCAALYALARRPQESSLPVLTAALADPDADTAALAARALGLLGRVESIGPLAAAVVGTRTPVTISAMEALRAVLERHDATRLPANLRERLIGLGASADPNLAVPALALLRWLTDDREVFRRLWMVASAGRERRQQVALQSLMAGLGEKSESLADTAIGSTNPYLRAAAAEALSFLPEADAAPRRARLAADADVIVRVKLVEGLKTPESVRENRKLVDGLLADPDAGVRAAAIGALALLEDPAMLPVFRDAVVKSYADRAPDVPIEAIAAAEKLAARSEARAVVEAAYRHPSTVVSRLARRALVKSFHADPAGLPWREYVTGKSIADYGGLLAAAHRPLAARIETVRGSFTMRLAGDAAPMTAMNFVELARKGYFDGLTIHRVVPNFVIQDGDPTGTGNGGPGYEIRDEVNTIAYQTGTVGMALSGPDTGGSQWFVTLVPELHLDGIYTVFGSVVSGMDIVNRIEQGDRIVRVTVSAGQS